VVVLDVRLHIAARHTAICITINIDRYGVHRGQSIVIQETWIDEDVTAFANTCASHTIIASLCVVEVISGQAD
jgi:hypothetical protein